MKQRGKTPDAREISLNLIREVFEDGRMSHLVLKEALAELDREDPDRKAAIKSMVSRLTMGTIEKKITLDEIIDRFSKTKTAKMKPFIRNLLRMSVYQIIYMDQIPDAAACNEAVRLAKQHHFGNLSGFVNGVLRSIARQKETLGFPVDEENPVRAIKLRYSLPEWLAGYFLKHFGKDETVRMLECLEHRKEGVTVRVNTSRITMEEAKEQLAQNNLQTEEIRLADHMFRVKDFYALSRTPLFQNGFVQVQNISSALTIQVSGVRPGDLCMDLCAAPGGKTIHLADRLNGSGKVLSFDVTEKKVELICENLMRCGFENVTAMTGDATVPLKEYAEKADFVLVDAPCSGLGVLGEKADIKYRLKEEDIASLAALSRNILKTAYDYLKPGGTLVFCTCTMTVEENEENRKWLLDNFDLLPVDLTGELDENLLSRADHRQTAGQGYLSLKITEDYDGFFISKYRKVSS